jgi:hypothetical protein
MRLKSKEILLLITLLFFFYFQTKGQDIRNSATKIDIGSEFEGGILFYKQPDGKSGLVVAKSDLGKMSWERAKLECLKYEIQGHSSFTKTLSNCTHA